jgi:transcriptional regulator
MYARPVERELDTAKLVAFARAYPFATFVSAREGVPEATHLPVLVHERDGHLVLAAHMARANPHWRMFETGGDALVIFQGPHAYVSPSWYEERLSVPTWDYLAVHARGPVKVLEAADALHHVAELTSAHDPAEFERMRTLPHEWLETLVRGIVAFEVRVTSIEGRFKLSQNRTLAEQANVARELSSQPEPARAVGALIAANLAHAGG